MTKSFRITVTLSFDVEAKDKNHAERVAKRSIEIKNRYGGILKITEVEENKH